jgi:endonuclease III
MAGKRLQKIVETLAKRYEAEGKKCELTDLRDPFLLGAWHILGQHAKRNGQARAYEALRRAKGTSPGNLLDLPSDKLAAICQIAGPYEDARAKDLYGYADDIEEKCGQDFGKVFKRPVADARKFLEADLRKTRAFADFLLLYGGNSLLFPVDARVARVATRLGFCKLKSDKELDDKAYKTVQKALEAESPKNAEWLIRAHGLLCLHGNDTCHAATPACDRCPLMDECLYVKKHPPKKPEPQYAGRQ